jgi:hypothetical protein
VQSIANYNPNEVALKVASLQATYNNLNTLNNAATNALNALSLARNQRNLSFYDYTTGVISATKKVKAYIRQILGFNSEIYHKATAIKFVKYVPKKKKAK